jgi:hypothetical protein
MFEIFAAAKIGSPFEISRLPFHFHPSRSARRSRIVTHVKAKPYDSLKTDITPPASPDLALSRQTPQLIIAPGALDNRANDAFDNA